MKEYINKEVKRSNEDVCRKVDNYMVEQNNQFNFLASKLKNIEDANQSLSKNVINNIQTTIKENNNTNNDNVIKLDEIKSNLNSNYFELIQDLKDTILSEIRLTTQFSSTQMKNFMDTAAQLETTKVDNTKRDLNAKKFESTLKILSYTRQENVQNINKKNSNIKNNTNSLFKVINSMQKQRLIDALKSLKSNSDNIK